MTFSPVLGGDGDFSGTIIIQKTQTVARLAHCLSIDVQNAAGT